MKIEDIKRLDGDVITDDEFVEIEESEYVTSMWYNGYSEVYYNKQWFTLKLIDNSEVDIYA